MRVCHTRVVTYNILAYEPSACMPVHICPRHTKLQQYIWGKFTLFARVPACIAVSGNARGWVVGDYFYPYFYRNCIACHTRVESRCKLDIDHFCTFVWTHPTFLQFFQLYETGRRATIWLGSLKAGSNDRYKWKEEVRTSICKNFHKGQNCR